MGSLRCLLVLGPWLAVAAPAGSEELNPLGAWFGGYERLSFDDELAWPGAATGQSVVMTNPVQPRLLSMQFL